jgi:hypothetical protein
MTAINPDEDPASLIEGPKVASAATLIEEMRSRGRSKFEGYLQSLDILNRPEHYDQLLTDFVLTDSRAAWDTLSSGLLLALGNVVLYADTVVKLDPTNDPESVINQLVSEGYDECADILNESASLAAHRPNPLADQKFVSQIRQLMQRLPHSYSDRQNTDRLMPELLGGVEISPRFQGFLTQS